MENLPDSARPCGIRARVEPQAEAGRAISRIAIGYQGTMIAPGRQFLRVVFYM